MYDAKDIVYAVKKMALDAVDARQDCDFVYGKVISTEPLTINIAQGIDLTNKQLVLTKNVTNYETTVTIDSWTTESSDGHSHSIKGTRNITINNALEVDDIVILLRKKGGQTYLVLDKVVEI